MMMSWRVPESSIPMTGIEAGIEASDANGHNNKHGTAAAR